MEHADCLEQLIDHHFGELDDSTEQRVITHLSSCASCALEFCRLRADLGVLRPVAEESPRPAVRAALRARVEATFTPSWWTRFVGMFDTRVPLYQPALALAAILTVAVMVWPVDDPLPRLDDTTILDEFDATGVELIDERIL